MSLSDGPWAVSRTLFPFLLLLLLLSVLPIESKLEQLAMHTEDFSSWGTKEFTFLLV